MEVKPGGEASVDFLLSLATERYEITVTASEQHETTFESFQDVESLNAYDLAEGTAISLGEALDHRVGTGIAKRSFGPGSSRPIIRGFDGDRVLIMEDGINTGTLSSQSGDHGELINVGQLARLEIVKGPATLLYSGNAMGGTVNAISRHHEHHPPPTRRLSRIPLGFRRDRECASGRECGLRAWCRKDDAVGPRRRDSHGRLHSAGTTARSSIPGRSS